MRDDLIKDILDVLKYNKGDFFIGGIQRCKIAGILGLNYAHSNSSDYERAIENAEKSNILKIHKYLKPDIDYMKKNPVTICTRCGK